MAFRIIHGLFFFGWLTAAVCPVAAAAPKGALGLRRPVVSLPVISLPMVSLPVASLPGFPAVVAGPHPASPVSESQEILIYVNRYRRSKGLAPLAPDTYISSVALGHSRDMLTGKTPFGHDGFRQRIDQISGHLGRLHVAAENVASGPMGAREVVDGWLRSPGHRRNIEGDFKLTGIGLAYGRDGNIYFTQIFVR